MLSSVAILLEILPILLFILFRKRNNYGGLWVILLSIILSFLSDFIRVATMKHINPLYFYASFTIVEYSVYALFLFLSLEKRIFKNILIFASLAFYLIAASNFFTNGSENFDSLPASAEAVLIIVYSIFYLYEQVTHPSVLLVYTTKKFWIILAFLIYFSSTLFLFIYATAMDKPENNSYWKINNFFDLIKNLLFIIAFILKPDKEKKNQQTVEYPFLDPN